MTFIETVPPETAAPPVAALYEADSAVFGHIPNFARAFSLRPEVYAAWKQLNGSIKAGMDLRRYELATVAAAAACDPATAPSPTARSSPTGSSGRTRCAR